jgi:putative chitinase
MAKKRGNGESATLRLGDEGGAVRRLQQLLRKRGFSPGAVDGKFGLGTEAAVLAYQRSEQLLADGIAGPRTLGMLQDSAPLPLASGIGEKTPQQMLAAVSLMFPHTPLDNIERNLPPVLDALKAAELLDRLMLLMALGTIRAETESFEPVAEGRSRYNTSPGGHPFDLYDNRRDLGNTGKPDGERFRGRGYVQLTGRDNYARFGKAIRRGNELLDKPELASDPAIAGALLAAFLAAHERAIKEALLEGNLKEARRQVNGGSHGLDRFTEAYTSGLTLFA